MKIVINRCFGGFGISPACEQRMREIRKESDTIERGNLRSDPALIQAIEELGAEANGRSAELKIVEIPDGIEWIIQEYDGIEWIAEKHRSWH